MSDLAIKVEKLSKEYKIGLARERHDTLRDALTSAMYAPFRVVASMFNGRRSSVPGHTSSVSGRSDIIWALKDVSFEVKQAEVIGIIGRNGAGKSTLLKILSRITEPTSGRAEIYGRISSLLEVGIGFHSELTGRENIYLNGAILGMKKAEINRKFDEIVAFSEIEKFIDTPVKRYSSGMYVRLAFAVAAHMEPEILIVDEVLAVGDDAFQKKCLGKMGEVSKQGRTVLFVSHNMLSIQSLCRRVLLLREGTIRKNGEPHTVISHYLSEGLDIKSAEVDLVNHPRRSHSREPALRRAWTMNGAGVKSNSTMMGQGLTVCFQFRCSRAIRNPAFGFEIADEHGRPVYSLNNLTAPTANNTLRTVVAGVASFYIPSIPLLPGIYTVTLSLVEGEHDWVDCVEGALAFEVQPADVYRSGKIPDPTLGIVFVPGQITVRPEDSMMSESDLNL
jgi:lipopolysaccharide transport system ATP-binding protein